MTAEKAVMLDTSDFFRGIWLSQLEKVLFIFYFNFFATPQIKMKTIQEKIERMDLTMARRPKGNYEAYIN